MTLAPRCLPLLHLHCSLLPSPLEDVHHTRCLEACCLPSCRCCHLHGCPRPLLR
jgi:hypothetical protein